MFDGVNNKERSVLFNSPLYSCITSHDGDIVSNCLDVFESETAVLLTLTPYGESERATKFVTLRPFILKVLIYLGFKPIGEKFAVIMRLVELLVFDGDFDRAIANCATSCGREETVLRAIDSEINMYNGKFVDKLSALTDTTPLSPRDALFDMAMYVRNEYLGRMNYNA